LNLPNRPSGPPAPITVDNVGLISFYHLRWRADYFKSKSQKFNKVKMTSEMTIDKLTVQHHALQSYKRGDDDVVLCTAVTADMLEVYYIRYSSINL